MVSSDMIRIPKELIEHKLNKECDEAIIQEVAKLVEVRILIEVPVSRHMFTKKGIKAIPKKIKAIDMIFPQTMREVQSLNEKLAAMGSFLAKSAEKALPFDIVLL
ncbi:hypothetical protein Tco_0367430 [Tanacetum coccineum]